MEETRDWREIVDDGVKNGASISQIAKMCFPFMGMQDEQRAYNLVKKQYYRVTRGRASGSKVPIFGDKKTSNQKIQPQEGVKSFTQRENGDTVFEGFIKAFEGKQVTPEAVLRICNTDPSMWVVISYTCNVWQGQTKEGGDKNGKTCLWQFKVVMRPRKNNELLLEDVKEDFAALLKSGAPQWLPVKQLPPKIKHKMLEINISDLHFAKLSWAPECGENYDYKIARDSFFQIIDAECRRLESGEYEEILFVWTNDFFNSDIIDNTTTGGTQQNTDIRWQKMFLNGMRMLVEAIDKLQQYAPVRTFYIASNHSRTTEWYGINYLYAWFRDNPRVTVDLTCKARYYIQYGVNLIGFSHSSYEKKQNLPHLMSVEVPRLWAETKYREFHLAHIHSERVEEKGGIVFRWLPSVTAADAWHYDSGYIGAAKRSYSFTWDREEGLAGIHVAHVNQKHEVK